MRLKLEGRDQQILLKWWHWLEVNRGHRAKLRRATSPQDIMMMESFFKFLKFSIEIDDKYHTLSDEWRNPENFYTAATLCGLLSRVKIDTALDENEPLDAKEKRTLRSPNIMLVDAESWRH